MSSLGMEMEKRRFVIHPQKFALWLFILSVIMIFGGLTSAYIVQRSFVPDPIIFDLPSILWSNLALILFGSVTMQYAVYANKKGENQKALIGLGLTFFLGVFFLLGQWNAWGAMVDSGLHMVDPSRKDNSVSYFYVFTGLHGAHIIAALIVLLVAGIKTYRNSFKPGRKKLTFEMTATFWHFLGLLWVYLFVFLLITQKTPV